jgi:hypothetical protein
MYYEWSHAVAAPTNEGGENIDGVDMTTGDKVCADRAFAPDVIKIDVEGHEVKVLSGLQGILSQYHPLIFLEVHPQRIVAEGDSLEELCSRLEGAGYIPRGLDWNEVRSLTRVTRIVLDKSHE